MKSVIISDIHLSPRRPEVTRAFNHFLENIPEGVGELFILGDLFELWLGDDDESHFAQAIVVTLRTVSRSGVRLYFQAGNRDFLIGEQFAKQTGAKLLPEFIVQTIRERKILLTHGDLLCTDDHDYQRFRRRIQAPFTLWLINHLPLGMRQRIAATVWKKTKQATQNKPENIMDVNQDTVVSKLEEYGVDTLIHGHTHRPAVHQLTALSGGSSYRYTLGDWDDLIWWIEVSEEDIQLKSRPTEQAADWAGT